jgi:hypothetical protein
MSDELKDNALCFIAHRFAFIVLSHFQIPAIGVAHFGHAPVGVTFICRMM